MYFFHPFGIRFLIKNRIFWKGEYKDVKLDNGYILVEINSNIFLTLGTAILANYIAIVKKLKIIYISFGSKNQEDFLIDVRHSFLNAEFWYFDDFIVEANDIVEIEYTKELKKIKTPDNLYSYKYKGLYIGDLIYDEVLRNDHGMQLFLQLLKE